MIFEGMARCVISANAMGSIGSTYIAASVMVEAELVLGGLEAVPDDSAAAFDLDQGSISAPANAHRW